MCPGRISRTVYYLRGAMEKISHHAVKVAAFWTGRILRLRLRLMLNAKKKSA